MTRQVLKECPFSLYISTRQCQTTQTPIVTHQVRSTDEGNVKLGFYIASLILGFGGNSLVITVMSRKKQKRSIPRLFILNLAISDLSFILIATPRCTNKHLLLHQHNLPKLVLLSTFNTSGDNLLFR